MNTNNKDIMTHELLSKLKNYQKYFGNILFPDELTARQNIYKNPENWMYSFDGQNWKQTPMNIHKIDYMHALFRLKPKECILGVTEDIKNHPESYQYSHNNGLTWTNLQTNNPSSHHWIYHGTHNSTWFRKIHQTSENKK